MVFGSPLTKLSGSTHGSSSSLGDKVQACLELNLTVYICMSKSNLDPQNLFNFSPCHNGVNFTLSYDVPSKSEIMPCIKIDKPLVIYRFSGNIMK